MFYDAAIFLLIFPNLGNETALDGLTYLETFFSIFAFSEIFIGCTGNIAYMGSWNNFLTPLLIVSDSEMFTLPLGLNTFKGQYISYWNYIMAASMVFTLPTLAIYAFF